MSNTPSFTDANYTKHSKQIALVQDIFFGVDTAVKHLRQFPKEKNEVYQERQTDSALDNFVFSTIETVKNIIFRKPIDLTGITNKTVLEWSNTINFHDTVNEFAKTLVVNRIRDGKTYILVDRMVFDEEAVKNGSQQTDLEKRPYFVNVLRENLLNYEKDVFGKFTRVSIREYYTERVGAFGSETKEQIKVWYSDGKVEIWRDDKVVKTIQTKLREVPLIEIGKDENPPLYDQAKINIQHLNRNSECSNYVRVGASPFLAIYGSLDGEAPKTLGINSGLKFTDKQTSGVEWVMMDGKNYEIINNEITKLVDQMLRKAIEVISESNNKTATQVEKESMPGESKLTDYATEIESGLNKAYKLMQLFSEAKLGENIIATNKDFDNSILTPEQANSYRQDYLQGVISLERLWSLYERGEYIPVTTDKEKTTEKALIKDGNL